MVNRDKIRYCNDCGHQLSFSKDHKKKISDKAKEVWKDRKKSKQRIEELERLLEEKSQPKVQYQKSPKPKDVLIL